MLISLIGCKDNIFLAKMLRKPKPQAKPYKVEHYKQNIADNKYTLVKADTQKLFGKTGELTKAVAKTYPCFKPAKAFSQAKIKADGSTIIKIYYDKIEVSGISLNKSELVLNVDKTEPLKATISPSNALNKKISWTSSDTAVATVDKNGKVTAVKKGKATISATTADGKKTATCIMTVTDTGSVKPVDAEGFVEITPPKGAIEPKDGKIGATVEDKNYYKGVFVANRKVKLSPYKIAETEVTYKLWKEVYDWATTGAGKNKGYVFANAGRKGSKSDGSGMTENHPVTYVSWRDVIVWCNAYTEKTKGEDDCVYRDSSDKILRDSTKAVENLIDITKMKGKKGYRLPTEAEWEYAARWQGSKEENAIQFGSAWLTKLNYLSGASADYNSTEASKEVAWYRANSESKTHEVGTTEKANGSGLYDMSGNVWEWCFDRIGSWDEDPTGSDSEYTVAGVVTDPLGVSAGSDRVGRGGGWDGSAEDCSVGFRDDGSPYDANGGLGFRLSCTP